MFRELSPARSSAYVSIASVATVVTVGTSTLIATAAETFATSPHTGALSAERRLEIGTAQGVWLLAAVTLSWLALSATASAARRIVPSLRACTWLDRATLPSIRMAFDKLLVAGIISGATLAMSTTARADSQIPRPAAAAADHTTRSKEPPYVRGARATSPTPTSPTPTGPSPMESEPQPQPGPTRISHVVVRGDNLWNIAHDELRARGGTPSNQAVAEYWGALLLRNRHLRSGNPSLIYPGEIIYLTA